MAPDSESPIARAQRVAKRAREQGDFAQAEKFENAARALGCDFEDEDFFSALQKLAESKGG